MLITTKVDMDRRSPMGSILLGGLIIILAPQMISAQAQQGTPNPTSGSTSTQSSNAPAFPVSSGDLLDIRVFNTPELSAQTRVNEQGAIQLPIGGALSVDGLTADQIAVAIEHRLIERDIMHNPHVGVSVVEYATQGITVLGEVKSPGIYSLFGRHTLYDVLAAAGGPTQNQGPTITITHKNDPSHPENIEVHSPNYSAIQNAKVLLPGDTVMLSRADVFYVVGDVGKSGAFYFQNGQPLTVMNALSLAGSPNWSASIKHASIVRKNATSTELISLNIPDIFKAKQADVELRAGDILFVPGSLFKRVSVSAIPGLATGLATTSVSSALLR